MPKQKLLLLYVGNEQESWGAISYPRPAHYYIMPGILYCAQSLEQDAWISEAYNVSWRFFNSTVQSRREILETVLRDGASIVGFSLFCWNAPDTLWLAEQVKAQCPHCVIMGGGPEVSMESAKEAAAFFLKHPAFDLLVFGEAETKIARLVRSVSLMESPHESVTGFAFSPALGGACEFAKGYLEEADHIPSIYPFSLDIQRSPGCGLAMVFETGRGCPYRCVYCQFSHRNHKPYRFSLQRVRRELNWLFEQGIECIHFADAVFDLDPQFAKDVLNVCLRGNRGTSLFFYCSFYKLDDELARLFAQSQAQICVGVQTTNPQVLAKIKRQLSPRLFHDIRDILVKYPLNFYVDLIFGLPLDTFDSFKKSFSDVLNLGPSFVMVFPLTLIKGTPLQRHPQEYGMRAYSESDVRERDLMCGIEYRNIGLHANFSLENLSDFDDLALAVFYYYNRFRLSLSYLEKRCGPDTARMYQTIGKETKAFLRKAGQIATNTNFIHGFEHEIKAIFLSAAVSAGAETRECTAFEELFKLDIFRILMNNSPQREKMFARASGASSPLVSNDIQPGDECRVLRIAPGKAVNNLYLLSDLSRLHLLKETITPCNDLIYICAPFSRWDIQVFSLSAVEKFLLDTIPTDKPMRLRHLMQSARRAGILQDEALRHAIARLAELDIVSV